MASQSLDLSLKVAGVGDFNGDGKADILWRNDDGTITDWLGQFNAVFRHVLEDAAKLARSV
jgi:hypothetical protein